MIITEYDLPNPLIQPHDVMLDGEGSVWYSDFGQMFERVHFAIPLPVQACQ